MSMVGILPAQVLQKLLDPNDPVPTRNGPRLCGNNFVRESVRLRANLYLPMKQASVPATTCPIYMTKVAISQKKVSDNFYQIPAHCG